MDGSSLSLPLPVCCFPVEPLVVCKWVSYDIFRVEEEYVSTTMNRKTTMVWPGGKASSDTYRVMSIITGKLRTTSEKWLPKFLFLLAWSREVSVTREQSDREHLMPQARYS